MSRTQESISAGGHTIRVYRQRRRSVVMKTTPVGLVLFIPARLSLRNEQLRAFVADALIQIGDRVVADNALEVTSPAELRAMVKTWAERIGVKPTRVSVREMFRKWGSCSRKGSVSLNTALCRVPHELAEYVICHELVHLVEFNHGKGFKKLMSEHMPDWRAREEALGAWMAGGTLD